MARELFDPSAVLRNLLALLRAAAPFAGQGEAMPCLPWVQPRSGTDLPGPVHRTSFGKNKSHAAEQNLAQLLWSSPAAKVLTAVSPALPQQCKETGYC